MSTPFELPGECTDITSLRTVVVAPHYDDEVLGCGGLLSRLAGAGTPVHVLFLTDGAGGRDAVADRDAYARRRRRESEEAAAELGLSSATHLGLPDGSLETCLEALEGAIATCLLERRPDLLLLPSPLEITSDHRAPFAALHRLLAATRGGQDLFDVARDLCILLYEVNHPQHPDVLVDVSQARERIAAAMGRYRSQLERHDYLAAGLGLRRYRSLSLSPRVELAEAYRRLDLDAFRTRSAAQLVAALGGVPALHEVSGGPLVSVIVRTRDRPSLLAQALDSLARSTYRRVEAVLVNDGGASPEVSASFPFPVRRVELEENQGRAAAANAGTAAAGGEWITFLDDDDLVAPEHLETLVGLATGSGSRVVYTDAAVGIYEPDPEGGWSCSERSIPYSRDFDPALLVVDNYIPFHTLMVERRLFDEAGPFDPELAFFEDWDYLIRLSRLAPFLHLARVTCEYRHFRGGGHVLGEKAASQPDFLELKRKVLEKHRRLLDAETLARVTVDLRREGVEAHRECEKLRSTLAETEKRYHLVNGELAAVREESERRCEALAARQRELDRLCGEEARLRRGIEEQIEHLGRTYAEIERLSALLREREALVEEMRATWAWRFHRLRERLRR